MKSYIFFESTICGVNGCIQYLYNKVRYLETKGFQVFVFSGVKDEILVTGLKRYEKYVYPELFHSPFFFRKSEAKFTLNRILTDIGPFTEDNCIIESNNFHSSVWGEIVAERLNCRHFIYIVQEHHNYDEEMRKFLRFKYQRHELAGISKQSVPQIIGDENAEKRPDAVFSAFCTNVIDDCTDPFSKLLDSNADYTLGSFGRLSKTCVASIIDGFYSFARLHYDKKVNVVMIGGAQSDAEERKAKDIIRHKFKGIDNVKLIITGNIYPVPISFLLQFDVFVSTAGAANATYQAGFPTVKVTPDGNPLGIMGLDFEFPEKNFYEIKSNMTIIDCIERAIKNKESINYKKGFGEEYNKRMNSEFERQMLIVLQERSKEYYDENLLMKLKTGYPTHHTEVWILGHLFGAKGMAKIKKTLQHFRIFIK